jgi:dye decolorizing peroxidase
LSRRRLLAGGAATLGGVAAGRLAGSPAAASTASESADIGGTIEPCWGAHQAGVATPVQSFATYVGFTVRPGVTRADLARLMKVWTDDIERLTQGSAALADAVPELAGLPARLTMTVAVGDGLFALPGMNPATKPRWLRPLPPFGVDRLQPRWSGGDLVVQIGADDPIAVSHARQVMTADAREFATAAWTQSGFHRAAGTTPAGATGRNLMGFIDGTANPAPGSADFDRAVWIDDGPDWLHGGTGMVLRRIRIDLDTWASVDRPSREQMMGRRLSDGAPLTGGFETDTPDLAATRDGMLAIPEFAHVRLAHSRHPDERIFRRPYNYDDGTSGGQTDAGLLFVAFAADIDRQFVPIQERLQKKDLLNLWTTPIGSSVVAVLPGFESGGWLGQRLFG